MMAAVAGQARPQRDRQQALATQGQIVSARVASLIVPVASTQKQTVAEALVDTAIVTGMILVGSVLVTTAIFANASRTVAERRALLIVLPVVELCAPMLLVLAIGPSMA